MAFLFNPLHVALHHDLRWDLASSFHFARNESWVPIARSEARRLSFMSPVLVVERLRDWVPVVPIAAQGLPASPLDQHFRWRKGAPPAALAFHPFQAIPDNFTGEPLLAVAHDSETVRAAGSNPFFDAENKPTRQVKAVLRRLQQIVQERRQLAEAAAALGRAGLLAPVLGLSDRQGRHPFRTLDKAAFAAFPRERLLDLGPRPHHAFMLAAVLAYSSRFLTPEVSASAQPAAPAELPRPTPPVYGDDMELVFKFD